MAARSRENAPEKETFNGVSFETIGFHWISLSWQKSSHGAIKKTSQCLRALASNTKMFSIQLLPSSLCSYSCCSPMSEFLQGQLIICAVLLDVICSTSGCGCVCQSDNFLKIHLKSVSLPLVFQHLMPSPLGISFSPGHNSVSKILY